ncbi:sel1 repeat family protein [Rickettsiales bacterium]|nr:sel1 repeat family protein [Rickettsiales bacterium]
MTNILWEANNFTNQTDSEDGEISNEDIESIKENAHSGDAESQYFLGLMLDMGKGLDRDPQQAVIWYTKAAEQDHPSAQYFLGKMYDSQESGIPKDKEKAIYWYERASANHNFYAKAKLKALIEG